MIDERATKEQTRMNKHAIRTLVAAGATSLALIAVGSANAGVIASASTHGGDITPWTVTHGH